MPGTPSLERQQTRMLKVLDAAFPVWRFSPLFANGLQWFGNGKGQHFAMHIWVEYGDQIGAAKITLFSRERLIHIAGDEAAATLAFPKLYPFCRDTKNAAI